MPQISGADARNTGQSQATEFHIHSLNHLSINTAKSINAVAVTNVSSNASGIEVYGANVIDANITVMTALGSQWMATASEDIPEIGTLLVRAE